MPLPIVSVEVIPFGILLRIVGHDDDDDDDDGNDDDDVDNQKWFDGQ